MAAATVLGGCRGGRTGTGTAGPPPSASAVPSGPATVARIRKTPAPVDVVMLRALEGLLAAPATAHAFGASAAGAVLAGQFRGGDSLVLPVAMLPGRCYSIVAKALPPVRRVEIVGDGVPWAVQRQRIDPVTVVLGPGAACARVTEPTTVRFVLSVRGKGVAAVRAFAR